MTRLRSYVSSWCKYLLSASWSAPLLSDSMEKRSGLHRPASMLHNCRLRMSRLTALLCHHCLELNIYAVPVRAFAEMSTNSNYGSALYHRGRCWNTGCCSQSQHDLDNGFQEHEEKSHFCPVSSQRNNRSHCLREPGASLSIGRTGGRSIEKAASYGGTTCRCIVSLRPDHVRTRPFP